MRLLLAALLLAIASAAQAETIRVRAGEHSGYTRLVFDGATAFDWQIGRTDTGYGLVLEGDGIEFETGRTDRDLTAGRVTGIRAEDGIFYLDLGCECRAESFTLSGNRLVIDIRNGAPRDDDPTEVPLALTSNDSDVPVDTPPADGPEVSEAMMTDDLVPPPDEAEPSEATTALALPDFIGAAIEGVASSSSAAVAEPTVVDLEPFGAHSEFENMLVDTLSRAASEGFVTGAPAGIESGSTTIAANGEAPVGEVTGATGMTAYDLALDRGAAEVAPDACAATSAVDFLADPTAFEDVAIGPLIRDAYAEDGTINPPDALQLAYYMMASGFGAEAAQLIDLAGPPSDATEFLRIAALAIDGRSAGSDVDLARYAGCPGAGGLWALLAGADETMMERIDLPKAVQALSTYSPRMRFTLGPLLVTQLLTNGRPDDARLAASVIPPRPDSEESGPDHSTLSEVLLQNGSSDEAISALDAIIRAGGPETHDAVLLQSLEKSAAEAAPSEAEIETLRALQADADPGGQAGALFAAELRRLLDGSEFVTALDRILGEHPEVDADTLAGLEREAWSGLVALGSNFDFAYALRKWPGRIDTAGLEPGLMDRLAARVTEIGGTLASEIDSTTAETTETEAPEPTATDPSSGVLEEPKTVSDIRSLIEEVDAERTALEALLADAADPTSEASPPAE